MAIIYDKIQVGENMKAITIKQPFATLIAKGFKEYEFRTWRTKYRGEILIHAGKGIDKKAMERFKHFNLEYPTGCIIAKAKLVDCVYIDDDKVDLLRKKNPLVYYGIIHKEDYKDRYNKTWDGYGFKLENLVEVEPIYINGKLSLWDYEGEIHEKVSKSGN